MSILDIFKKLIKNNHKVITDIDDEPIEVESEIISSSSTTVEVIRDSAPTTVDITPDSKPIAVDNTLATEQKRGAEKVFFEKQIAHIVENSIEYCLYICRHAFSFSLKEVSYDGVSGESKVLKTVKLHDNNMPNYSLIHEMLIASKFSFQKDYLGNIGFDCDGGKFRFKFALRTSNDMDTAILNSKKNKEHGYIDIEELQEFLKEKRLWSELLFSFHSEDSNREYVSYYDRIYIDMITGIPYSQVWSYYGIEVRPGSVGVGGKSEISYDELIELAGKHSVEMYNKYKGINSKNWKSFFEEV